MMMSMLIVFTIKKLIQKITLDIVEVMNHFENGMAGNMMSKARQKIFLRLRISMQSKKLFIFRKKLLVMTKFPDMGQMLQFPDIFSKFLDLGENFVFFLTFP